VSPLAPADNAVVIDTSHKSREEVLSESLAMVRARLGQ